MRVTYISHATLLIEVNGVKIVTDPWVTGSSYCGQWHLFPKPLSPELIRDADFVLYSHGHEDHLHAESLLTVNKKACIFYPYSWYGGTKEFFNELGFHHVREIITEQRHVLANDVAVTYLSNNLDTIIVLEIAGNVLVNINDALPSASQEIISYFINKIGKKWKKIDYVFSSYGGASYFPNTVHYKDKHDVEIAEARELFFLTNFCRIVSALNPVYAVPFATDFVLLDDHQRWINTTKFARDKIKSFYATYTKNQSHVAIIEAYPDDYFLDNRFYNVSPYHQKKALKSFIDTIDEDYKHEIEEKRNSKKISASELALVFEKVKQHIVAKQYIIPEQVRKKIKFGIKITDAQGLNVLTVNFRDEKKVFGISGEPEADIDLLIEMKSNTLLYSIENEWGGDAIIIGYGAEIYIRHEDAVVYEYENYCVRLLSRYPNTKEYLRKSPYRALKYLLTDDVKRKNLLNKVFGNKDKIMDYTDAVLSKRDLWLSKSKCDVCKACNL